MFTNKLLIRRVWEIWFLIAVFFFLGTISQSIAANNPDQKNQSIQSQYSKILSSQTVSQKQQILGKTIKYQQAALQKFEQTAQLNQRLEQKIRTGIPANKKIAAFIREIKRQEAMGKSRKEIYAEINTRLAERALQGTGQIQGTVSVVGGNPQNSVNVIAFDIYGYPAGTADVQWDNSYTISGLESGQYYVLTESNYVDEFYNDIISNGKAGWRSATLVEVTDGGVASGINFDLQLGAVITGTVFQSDGTTPLAFGLASVVIYSATQEEKLFNYDAFTDANGKYSVLIGSTGSYKLKMSSYGYRAQFYNQKSSWSDADIVTVNSIEDTIRNINFSLTEEGGGGIQPQMPAGAIAGKVTGNPGNMPLNFAILVAFDLSDTSVAGLAISSFALMGGQVGPGEYVISPLKTGNYIVYANDLIGPYSKAYYDGSSTPAGASPVHVTEPDTTSGVDFSLNLGGSITGTVTVPDGSGADSVLVLAVRANILDEDKFFSNVDLGFAFTNGNGHYMIAGLSTGDYLLRTVALANSNYRNVALDEWYSDVHSIWDWKDATPVSVTAPRPVTGIDFALDPPGFIAGTVKNSDSSQPVGGVTLIALRADNNFPELAYGESDGETGNYILGPLPSGDYRVFAFVDKDNYLPEFYDGARMITGASTISVNPPATTSNVDFTLDKGATVKGFISLSPGFKAGADTLSEFPVMAYDAVSGIAMGSATVTFSGGYRIENLPPGSYKIEALPVMIPFAATYYGGGFAFDDANALTISVAEADVQTADITLGQGTELISGHVWANEDGNQVALPKTLVLAYDATGHAVSAGMTGFSIPDMTPGSDSSAYVIAGLRTGNYKVRTFSVINALESLSQLANLGSGQPGKESVPGQAGLGSGLPGLPFIGQFNFSLNLYTDEWYDDVKIVVNPSDVGVSLFWNLLVSKGDMNGFIPFYDVPLSAAANVSSGSSNIDFVLGKLNPKDIFSDVQEQKNPLPKAFVLEQSYPNPIHMDALSSKGIIIRYALKRQASVSITIYNVLGQKIANLVNHVQPAGFHQVVWNGLDASGRLVANGVYFYELKRQNQRLDLKKMIILR